MPHQSGRLAVQCTTPRWLYPSTLQKLITLYLTTFSVLLYIHIKRPGLARKWWTVIPPYNASWCSCASMHEVSKLTQKVLRKWMITYICTYWNTRTLGLWINKSLAGIHDKASSLRRCIIDKRDCLNSGNRDTARSAGWPKPACGVKLSSFTNSMSTPANGKIVNIMKAWLRDRSSKGIASRGLGLNHYQGYALYWTVVFIAVRSSIGKFPKELLPTLKATAGYWDVFF